MVKRIVIVALVLIGGTIVVRNVMLKSINSMVKE
jgi:hypothetical protein